MDWGPSVYSAIAASCSALTAFLVYRIQRRNFRESVRPELVLSGWVALGPDQAGECRALLRVTEIRNVGRGVAVNVCAADGDRDVFGPVGPERSVGTLPILGPGEKATVAWPFDLDWTRCERRHGVEFMPLCVQVYAWDRDRVRHRVSHHFVLSRAELGRMSWSHAPMLASLELRAAESSDGWRVIIARRAASLRSWMSHRMRRVGRPE